MTTTIEIRERLRVIEDEIDKLYWFFTRQARAKPPVLVRPELYQERAELEAELRRRNGR